jgi:ketosteroid isomerase-like protein
MHGADTVRREVRCAERALYDAMIARDFAALEGILAPDLAYVHSTAVTEGKEQYLAGVARGLYEYERIETPEARVRVHGQVALIDGVCDMRVGAAGSPKESIRLLFVLVWRHGSDGWRLVHRHATRIAAA